MASPRNPPRGALRIVWKAHKIIWKFSGRRLGTRSMGMGVIELTTRGRRTGSARTVLLSCLDSPDGLVVAGTNAGLDQDPAWVQNLRVDPRAELATKAGGQLVTAEFLAGADHDDAWARFQAADDQYSRYATMLTRPVPIVRFGVRGDGGSP